MTAAESALILAGCRYCALGLAMAAACAGAVRGLKRWEGK